MRRVLAPVLVSYRRLRFARWVLATRLRLAWSGVRLDLDAPHGAVFATLPRIEILQERRGRGGTFALRIDRGVRLGAGLGIEVQAAADNRLEIGPDALVGRSVSIKLRGGTIRLGPRAILRDMVVAKSAGVLELQADALVSYGAVIHCTEAITLEERVAIGERNTLIDSGHDVDGTDTWWSDQAVPTDPIVVGSNSIVLANAVLLKGVRIGRNSVVGANAVVAEGEYPDAAVIAGAPGRVVRTLAPGERPPR